MGLKELEFASVGYSGLSTLQQLWYKAGMNNKRMHIRVPFAGKAKIVAQKDRTDVTISNMSLGGLLFHTTEVFDLGKEVIIDIAGTFESKQFTEKVVGRIVASHRGPAGNSFGIRFLSYLSDDREPSLCAWVNSHQDSPSPSFLRSTKDAEE